MDRLARFKKKEEMKDWKRKAENYLQELITISDKEWKCLKKRKELAYKYAHCCVKIALIKHDLGIGDDNNDE